MSLICMSDMTVPFFIIINRTWDNYVGEFFLRPNVKKSNLWI